MWNKIQGKYIENKRVLFISTKNLDYIRNVQEIRLIKESGAECVVIGSYSSNYFIRLFSVFIKLFLVRMARFDTVFIGFAPQLVFPFFVWKFKKVSVVIDFFISFYDTLCFDREKIKADSAIGKMIYYIDKRTLQLADVVVCDTNAHGQYFCGAYQISAEKFFTVYLQADTSIFHPLKLVRTDKLKDKYIVLYFGSVLSLQGVDVVLRAMELLKEQMGLYFFFIGPIKDKKLEELKPISNNIEYIDWLPQDKLAEYIDWADLCLAGHFNAAVNKAKRTIPGKALIYRAMGKKMILGDNSATRELFNNDKEAIFVEMGNEQALAQVIMKQYEFSKGVST